MRTCSRCAKPPGDSSPRTKRSSSGQSVAITHLLQPVGVLRREVESVDCLQCLDLAQRRGGEGWLVLERVQHDALEQITQRHIQLGSEPLQHLEHAALETHSGLGAGDGFHVQYGNLVPKYQSTGCVWGACAGWRAQRRTQLW